MSLSKRRRSGGDSGGSRPAPNRGVAAGKRTLTAKLPPVQARTAVDTRIAGSETSELPGGGFARRAMVGPGYGGPLPFPAEPRPTENDGPGEVAAAGVAGPAETLPHGDAIQRSFGSQDVSDVRAHVGGHAADAADALGADAFATGNDVAFRESPDLHTAAHEAAHAVQQRGGVQLSDGVGQEGDAYERHADAVADRVVAGRSAADLLPADGQGSAAPATATQRKPVQKRPKKGEAATGGAPESAIDESEAIGTMQVAADVVQNRQRRLIDSAPQRARASLELLHQATVGTLQRERGSAPLEPSQRLDHLDRALRGLEGAMRAVHASDPGWFRAEFADHVERLRGDIQVDVARKRVNRAVLLPGEKAAVEVPKEGLSDETAAAYSQVVLPSIDKLIATYTMLNEQIIRVGHERFHHLFAEMQKGWDSGMLRMERSRFKDAGSIVTAQSALFLIKGLLSAPHAWEHASHAEGVVGKLESYTHLVQVAIETVGGLATLSAAIGACVVKLAGDLRLATQMMGFASLGTLTLANVVAAVELVHGILLVANPKSSADQKLQGAVQIGLGLAWFGGTLLIGTEGRRRHLRSPRRRVSRMAAVDGRARPRLEHAGRGRTAPPIRVHGGPRAVDSNQRRHSHQGGPASGTRIGSGEAGGSVPSRAGVDLSPERDRGRVSRRLRARQAGQSDRAG